MGVFKELSQDWGRLLRKTPLLRREALTTLRFALLLRSRLHGKEEQPG